MSMSVPELRLGFDRFDFLKAPQVPLGYAVRSFRPGDEDAWLAMLRSDSDWQWDRPRLDRLLAGEQGSIPAGGIIFATSDDVPVATACITLLTERGVVVPSLGWVVTQPEHRRRGLATVVCCAALTRIHDLGYAYTYLTTEPYRTTAIRMYLKLGFEPETANPGEAEWWAQFLA